MKAFKPVIFVLWCILFSCEPAQKKAEIVDNKTQGETEKTNIDQTKEEVAQLPTVSIKPNQKITSPLKIRVNSQGVWYANEGELGIVQLMDSEGNELAMGILSAEEEWMKEGPVMFSTLLSFDSKNAETGKLVIHNNPGDGDGIEAGEKKSFEIPVVF